MCIVQCRMKEFLIYRGLKKEVHVEGRREGWLPVGDSDSPPNHTTPPYVHHTTPHHITSHGTTPHHTTTVCTPNHTTSHHIERHHTTPPPYVHQTTLHDRRTYTPIYVTMVRLGKANHCSHECAFDDPSGRGSELNIVLVSYSGLSRYRLNLIYTGGL